MITVELSTIIAGGVEVKFSHTSLREDATIEEVKKELIENLKDSLSINFGQLAGILDRYNHWIVSDNR